MGEHSGHGGAGKGEGHGGGAHGGGGGGGGGHKKKHHHGHAHHEEHEEGWIVSFADNVLLMMGFFVILLAMNMGPKSKVAEDSGEKDGSTSNQRMLDFAIAVREAFHSPVKMDSTDPNDQPLIRRIRERSGEVPSRDPGPEGVGRNVQTLRPSDWEAMGGYVEFERGELTISEAGKATIAQVAGQLTGTAWVIEVRGHASRVETFRDIEKSRRLSYDRAWAVGEALAKAGVRWEQLLLVAAGDTDPVESRARTPDAYARNQRVEIVVTPQPVPADPYAESAAPTKAP